MSANLSDAEQAGPRPPQAWDKLLGAADWLLHGSLLLALGATGAVGILAPELAILIPVAAIGVAVLVVLWTHPLAHLCAVLLGFLVVFDYSEGLQVQEVAFGLYYLAYLAVWFLFRVLSGERLLRDGVDTAVLLYLIFATASLVLVPFFEADPVAALSQLSGVLVLGFYFPLKEACTRSERALKALVAVFAVLVIVVTFRNFLYYYESLQSAEALWEVMQNRARTNERQIMVGLVGGLAFLLYVARRLAERGALILFCFVLTAGVIAGQSRAIWVSVLVALSCMLILIDRRQRTRLLVIVAGGLAVVAGMVAILFGNLFGIILAGLIERAASLGTAVTQDVSLVNRFYEWRAAFEQILGSPVFGRGMGVSYSHFSLVFEATHEKTYVHNTYIAVLYRHGVIGLVLFLALLVGSIVRGTQTTYELRRAQLERPAFATALTCTAALPALALAAMTEGMMLNADGVFVLTYPIALLAGLRQRTWSREGPDCDR